ncbi:MAG: RNA-binding protein [Desulfobulbaceae bacterium]|nr:RNA-binding protein [Desulfobulbaceae bacterium]
MNKPSAHRKVRLDKWLWAARFFKTRSLAAKAVAGGHIHVNGARVKPSKIVELGEEFRIRRGVIEFIVVVAAVKHQRRPAVEARMLYEETEESIRAREKRREERRLLKEDQIAPKVRPSKRDRRLLRSFKRKAE